MAGLDHIKRQARKEAWYGDSWNPWRKNMRRSTFPMQSTQPLDIEAANVARRSGVVEEDETPLSHLSHFSTEPGPGPHSRQYSDGETIRRGSKEEYEMTTATGSANAIPKPREMDSQETAVERVPTRRQSEEEKARRRFLGKFRKDKNIIPEDDDKPKKRPWYKGKVLKHEPFTVRNQLNATLFNSWVNILLLAAPVGIALNYAGIDGKVVFVVNFIAIIPLAGMLSFATEEIALHVGESLGGLLNASFG